MASGAGHLGGMSAAGGNFTGQGRRGYVGQKPRSVCSWSRCFRTLSRRRSKLHPPPQPQTVRPQRHPWPVLRWAQDAGCDPQYWTEYASAVLSRSMLVSVYMSAYSHSIQDLTFSLTVDLLSSMKVYGDMLQFLDTIFNLRHRRFN